MTQTQDTPRKISRATLMPQEDETTILTKKKKRASAINFKIYLHKMINNLKINSAITKEGLCMLDNFIFHVGNNIERGLRIVKPYSSTKTVTIYDIYSVVTLYIGYKNVASLHANAMEHVNLYEDFIINKKEKDEVKEKGDKKSKPVQRSTKAGLILSVSRVEGVFIKNYERVSQVAMVYFAAILEHLLNIFLKHTIAIATTLNKHRIKTSHLKQAIEHFSEYDALTRNAIYPL